MRDDVSGYGLAREGDTFLWLVPVFMLTILILGLSRVGWERVPAVFALAGTVGGSVTAYLMYHEHSITQTSPKLIATQWTAFFWLGFVASLGITTTALLFYIKRSRSP
ncbi:MAG: hypothetical protein WAV20_19710 [Blastocatellia bacterium]